MITTPICLTLLALLPQDTTQQTLSRIRAQAEASRDYKTAAAALTELWNRSQAAKPEEREQVGLALVDLHIELGQKDAATAVLQTLDAKSPAVSARAKRLQQLDQGSLEAAVRELIAAGNYAGLQSLGAAVLPILEPDLRSQLRGEGGSPWPLWNALSNSAHEALARLALEELPRMPGRLRVELIPKLRPVGSASDLIAQLLLDPLTRNLAAELVSHCLRDEQSAALVQSVELLLSSDPVAAAKVFRTISYTDNLRSLMQKAIASPHAELNTVAARSLLIGMRGRSDFSLEPFEGLATHSSAEIRGLTADALKYLSEPGPIAVRMLERLSTDPEDAVRERVRAALQKDENIWAQLSAETVLGLLLPTMPVREQDYEPIFEYLRNETGERAQAIQAGCVRLLKETELSDRARGRALCLALTKPTPELLADALSTIPKIPTADLGAIPPVACNALIEAYLRQPAVEPQPLAMLVHVGRRSLELTPETLGLAAEQLMRGSEPYALESLLVAEPAGPRKLAWVQRMLANPMLAASGLKLIGQTRMPEMLPLLKAWVLDPRNDGADAAHQSAIEALRRYGNTEAAQIMLERIAGAPKPIREPYEKALEALTQYFEQRRAWQERLDRGNRRETTIRELLTLCEDQDPGVRAASARALARLEAVDELPRLIRMLKDSDAGVRAAAKEAFEQLHKSR